MVRSVLCLPAFLLLVSCVSAPGLMMERGGRGSEMEAAVQRHMSLEMYLDRQARLHTVAWNIRSSNADLCGRWDRGLGIMTVEPATLPPGLRLAAGSRFGSGLLVGAVAPFSPATGMLHPGDGIVAVNGVRTRSDGEFRSRLASARSDAVRVDVMRNGLLEKVLMIPVPVCRWPARVVEAPGVTAWVDGSEIAVTAGMMRFAADDDDLAQVVAHELAHAVLGHNERKLFADRTDEELEADRLGVFLAGRAGYRVERAAEFWRLVARENVYHGVESWRRFRALREAVKEFVNSSRSGMGGASKAVSRGRTDG